MAKSIIGGVTEEIKELGKDVAKESAKQPLEIGKDFFRQMIGMEGVTAPSKEEQEKNIAQKKQEEEKKTARIRKFLHEEQVKPALAKEESSVFEKQKQEEKQLALERKKAAEEASRKQLPFMSQKQKRGDLGAYQRRKMAHVEMGKTPGQ